MTYRGLDGIAAPVAWMRGPGARMFSIAFDA